MKKNLLLIPLSVIALGLTSCNKNTYTINKDKNITVKISDEGEEITINTFGYKDFNVKKGTTYTFVYDFSSAPTEHDIMGQGEKYSFLGLAFDFKVNTDKSEVKLNGNKLIGKNTEEAHSEDYDYEYGEFDDYPGCYGVVFNDKIYKMRKTDVITFSLYCNEDYENSIIIGIYGGD